MKGSAILRVSWGGNIYVITQVVLNFGSVQRHSVAIGVGVHTVSESKGK